jgi:hypothetical protein
MAAGLTSRLLLLLAPEESMLEEGSYLLLIELSPAFARSQEGPYRRLTPRKA